MDGHYLTGIVLAALGAYVLKRIVTGRTLPPLPPGPKGIPIIGNLADLPSAGTKEWEHWLKHKELYGPISSVTALGQTMVILNDAQAAIDLLEKRSAIHSSRPTMTFATEMVGWENFLVLQRDSRLVRAYRKNMHALLGTKAAASSFNHLQEVEVGRFLLRMLEKPADLFQHIQTEAGAVILKIAYGYTIEPHKKDPLVGLVDVAMEHFSLACRPGVWPVDIFPFLKYLPDFFPGIGFKRTARRWKEHLTATVQRPYAFVERQMSEGKHEPSYVSKFLERGNLSPEDLYVAKYSAASLYTGGADTTVSTIKYFFLAMALYPDVQQKAQEEIDRVIGTTRLPNAEDRDNLPYVNAICQELLRWHPVTPMGVAHRASKDDVYNGYLIPKGALLLPNIWAFTHDPKTYHDPTSFKPERFLGPNPERDPRTLSFGFGRRICPGRQLADNAIYLTVVQSLAALRISNIVDENGRSVEPVVDFLPGLISQPAPYEIEVGPRSAEHERLVREVERVYPWQESDSGALVDLCQL